MKHKLLSFSCFDKISDRYKKLGKNFILLLIGNFASKLLSFFLVPLYTYYLTTTEYGVSDLLVTTVSLACPLLTCSINEAVMRYALDDKYDNKQVFTIGFVINLFSFVAFLLILPAILMIDQFSDYKTFIVGYYFVYTGTLFASQFIKGINDVKHYTIAGILQTFAIIACNIFFIVCLGLGLSGYLYSYIIGYGVGMIYQVYASRLWRFSVSPLKLDKLLLKKMLYFSFPMIANSLAWWVINSSDKYMIKYISGASELGIYSVSYKIPTILMTITSMFSVSMRISSIEDFGSEKTTEFINNTYKSYINLLIPATATIILFSKLIASILFQKEFFIAWQSSTILLTGFLFYALAEFIGVVFLAGEKTNYIFYSCLFGATINIVLNWFLIGKLDGVGAAMATSISFFSVWLFRSYKSKKIICLKINISSFFILVISLIGMVFSMLRNYLGISSVLWLMICFISFKSIRRKLNK